MIQPRNLLIACTTLLLINKVAHSVPTADAKQQVFEICTYTTEPGKLPDLIKRFRDHATTLFGVGVD